MGRSDFVLVDSLEVAYQQEGKEITILDSVSLSLTRGRIGVIIGPSGCGKSTLLNVIAGLNHQYRGRVLINEKTPEVFSGTAFIFQDHGLLPWKTVWQNVTLGLQIKKASREEIKSKGEAILNKLGLSYLAGRYPAQLSGGQRQRIAIARSLVLDPELLLMDEPFSSLDALTREELQELLLQIWQETRLTILLVTHSIEEAVFLGQEIFVMTSFPGTVREKISNRLATDYGARGKMEFLELCNYLRFLLSGGKTDEVYS
ncbi:MAG TPA: ABC transporter ATP-binding protein [Clostridia bacterium]|nr:ABC transporter ATP-binding protein [Clostridia bacterium]